MLQKFYSPLLTLVLLAGGLTAQAALAQTPVAGLEPHVDLAARLQKGSTNAAGVNLFDTQSQSTAFTLPAPPSDINAKLFNDPQPIDGGWKGLANLLEALTPGVDTEIALTPSQITDRITVMLNQGQNQEALNVIEKRMAQQSQQAIGTDVQLMFLHGRALGALNRHNEAIEVYLKMTTLYPELPEPWNNLAAEYVKQGKLDMAQDAIQMALTANPQYPAGKANLGQIQLMQARQSFDSAAQLGVGDARAKAEKTQAILQH